MKRRSQLPQLRLASDSPTSPRTAAAATVRSGSRQRRPALGEPESEVPGVAGERFVAPDARQHDLHVTCAVAWATANVGMAEESAKGSSK